MRTATPSQSSSITGGMGTLACVSSVWRTSQVRDAIDFWSLTFCLCPFLSVGFLAIIVFRQKSELSTNTGGDMCSSSTVTSLKKKTAFEKAYFNLRSNVYRSIFVALCIFFCVCIFVSIWTLTFSPTASWEAFSVFTTSETAKKNPVKRGVEVWATGLNHLSTSVSDIVRLSDVKSLTPPVHVLLSQRGVLPKFVPKCLCNVTS